MYTSIYRNYTILHYFTGGKKSLSGTAIFFSRIMKIFAIPMKFIAVLGEIFFPCTDIYSLHKKMTCIIRWDIIFVNPGQFRSLPFIYLYSAIIWS